MTVVFLSLGLIGALLILGKVLRNLIKPLQHFYIPSSVIAGIAALLLGPQVLGRLSGFFFGSSLGFDFGLWPQEVLKVWSGLPGILINIVFAGLFLGKFLPSPRNIWKKAGPMVAHGQALAWGQYVVGLSIALILLRLGFSFSPLAGALIEIGFEGGHGTAAGLADTFRNLGFSDGADLALGLATLGVVAGVLLGTVFINWGARKGYIEKKDITSTIYGEPVNKEILDDTSIESSYKDRAIEPLSIHLGVISLAIGLGWVFLRSLVWLEAFFLVPWGWPQLMPHVPLFPLAMVGGVAVQKIALVTGFGDKISRKLINRFSGMALDILIVAALATISLSAIGDNFTLFFLMALGGILWNVWGFFVLARVIFKKNWFIYGLANFGQGTGMTVIGLLLVRMADPLNKTEALEAFGYKQLLFEPVVGGGIFTAASLPLIAEFGLIPMLTAVTLVMLGWIIYGWRFIKQDG